LICFYLIKLKSVMKIVVDILMNDFSFSNFNFTY